MKYTDALPPVYRVQQLLNQHALLKVMKVPKTPGQRTSHRIASFRTVGTSPILALGKPGSGLRVGCGKSRGAVKAWLHTVIMRLFEGHRLVSGLSLFQLLVQGRNAAHCRQCLSPRDSSCCALQNLHCHLNYSQLIHHLRESVNILDICWCADNPSRTDFCYHEPQMIR